MQSRVPSIHQVSRGIVGVGRRGDAGPPAAGPAGADVEAHVEREQRIKGSEQPAMSQHQHLTGQQPTELNGSAPAGLPANWAPPRPTQKAAVIGDDAEAVAVAKGLAPVFAQGAADRDRSRRYPLAELDVFSQSGLWGITIPKANGGAGVSQATVAKVFAILASADPSLTQISQNHFEIVNVIRVTASPAQKEELFGAILAGHRLGNAFSEPGGRMSRTSRPGLPRMATLSASTARNSIRPARCSRISSPSSRWTRPATWSWP